MAGAEENPSGVGQSDIPIESQKDDEININRLSTFEAPRETRTALSDGQEKGGGREGDSIKQSTQPTQGPFFTRPEQEDPISFQASFQFSKAPIPKTLPIQRNVPLKSGGFQSELRDDGMINAGQQHGGPGNRATGIKPHDSEVINGPETQEGDVTLNMTMKTHDEVIPHTIKPPNPTSLYNDEIKSRGLNFIQNVTPLKKPLVQSRQQQGPTRSPAAGLGKSRLPKAFSDIQRKALIQLNDPDRTTYFKHLPNSQASSSSPSETGVSMLEKKVVGANNMRQSQGKSTVSTNLDEPSQSPKTHAFQGTGMQQKNEVGPVVINTSSPQGVPKDHRTITRPPSQSSNVAKPRIPRSRGHTSARGRPISPTLGETDKLRHVLSRSWNQFFIHEDQRNKRWEEKIAHMAEQLDERNKIVKVYLEKIQDKNETIRKLRFENEEQKIVQQAQEDAFAKLEKRHQLLKTNASGLNAHIEETKQKMETMLMYFRPRYHEMRDQLELGKRENENAIERIISENDKARDEIRKHIENSRNEVYKLSETKIRDLHLEINTLRVTLEEQKKNVDQERATVDHLRQDLKNAHEVKNDVLASLKTYNQELMKGSDEKMKRIEDVAQCVREQGQGIQSLLAAMKSKAEAVLSPIILDERLKSLQTGMLDAIHSAAEESAILQREACSQISNDLKTGISYVRELCANISEQEQNRKTEVEWQEALRKSQIEHGIVLREANELKGELTKMRDQMKTHLEQHTTLQQENTTLKARVEAVNKLGGQVEGLKIAKHNIELSLKTKETHIENLENNLKDQQETLCDQNQRLKDQELKLIENQQEHIREITRCHEKHRQAIEQMKTEESAKAQAVKQSTQQQLRDVEQERSQLKIELAEAKRKAETAMKTNLDETEKHVHQILESAGNRIDKTLEGLRASDQAQGELRMSLEAWHNEHIELGMLQRTVQELIKNQQEAFEDSKLLKGLLDVQLMLDKTWQSHKSEVDALGRATELEKSVKADMDRTDRRGPKGKPVPVVSHVANRHVTIQFPGSKHISDGNMAPVSIEEERTTRRQAASPTGIMKSAVLRVEELPEKPHQGTPPDADRKTGGLPKRGTMNRDKGLAPVAHTAYNRPVLGASAAVGELAPGPILERAGAILTDTLLGPKRKRTEIETDQSNATEQEEPQQTKKRQAKISRSMSNYFRAPMSGTATAKQIQPQIQPIRLRGGPIERKPSAFVTYGASSFGLEAHHCDTSTSATLREGPRGPLEES